MSDVMAPNGDGADGGAFAQHGNSQDRAGPEHRAQSRVVLLIRLDVREMDWSPFEHRAARRRVAPERSRESASQHSHRFSLLAVGGYECQLVASDEDRSGERGLAEMAGAFHHRV